MVQIEISYNLSVIIFFCAESKSEAKLEEINISVFVFYQYLKCEVYIEFHRSIIDIFHKYK